jgi:hypothetical protein
MGGAYAFSGQGPDASVVVTALSIASLTYGPLLGTYVLAAIPGVGNREALVAIFVTFIVMSMVVLGFPTRLLPGLAWPWFVPIGTLLCVFTGFVASRVVRLVDRAWN